MEKTKKKKHYYAVLNLVDKMSLKSDFLTHIGAIEGQERIVDLKNAADGCCGVFPVFTNKSKAKKFAGEKYQVVTLETV